MTADTSQLEKILSVVKLMNDINSGKRNDNNNIIEESSSDMDGKTALRRIKETVPFLDMPYRRNISMMLRLMEIGNLVSDFRAMSVSGENNTRAKKQMLLAIRPELEERKQRMVDVFVKVMEINELMEDMGREQ